jgi:hypothetical protein
MIHKALFTQCLCPVLGIDVLKWNLPRVIMWLSPDVASKQVEL